MGLVLLAGTGQARPVGNVQIINTNAGHIMTAHADQYGDKVYIGGLANRPSAPAIGAHVHIWGMDGASHVFCKTVSVYFNGKPSFVRTTSYVASVDPAVFSRAKTIYVTFHSGAEIWEHPAFCSSSISP